jgi:hypothetical protein
MKNTQIKLLGILLVAAFLNGCGKEETPQESASQPEKPVTVKPSQPPLVPPNVATTSPANESNPSAGRQPKRKHPHLIIPPDQPNPTIDRLQRELGGIKMNDPEFAMKVSRLWKESVAQLSAATLPSATDAKVANGTRLPKELEDALHARTNKNDDASPQDMLNGLGVVMASTQTDLLPQYAQERMNALPPTATDLAIFEALNRGIGELNPSSGVATFERWEPLAKARNPLYRLLALRAAIRTTSRAAFGLSSEDPNYTRIDGPAKLGFYLSFLDESDPIILAEAIAAVATVPTPEARQAIEKFQAVQQQRGDAALAQAAADALRTQEMIAQSLR